jgi:signal transduction histidine kinase
VAPHERGCADCRADVCLSDVPVAGQLARVARVLIELGGARTLSGRAAGQGRGPLARSERLEALGRLTGGIVHDFNNLLFVMTGQIELARRQLSPDHPAFARLAPALDAAERAAALNRRLLAFGRGSPTDPCPADLNAVVAQLDRMLQRVVGRTPAGGPRGAGLWGASGPTSRDGAARPEPRPQRPRRHAAGRAADHRDA